MSFRVGIKRDSKLENFKSISKISTPVLLTSTVEYHNDPLLFLLFVNDKPQAVGCELFLYSDDFCLGYQHRDVKAIDTKLKKNISNVYN